MCSHSVGFENFSASYLHRYRSELDETFTVEKLRVAAFQRCSICPNPIDIGRDTTQTKSASKFRLAGTETGNGPNRKFSEPTLVWTCVTNCQRQIEALLTELGPGLPMALRSSLHSSIFESEQIIDIVHARYRFPGGGIFPRIVPSCGATEILDSTTGFRVAIFLQLFKPMASGPRLNRTSRRVAIGAR